MAKTNEGKRNTAIVAVLILAAVAVGGYLLFADGDEPVAGGEGSPEFQFQDDDGDRVIIDF